MRVFNNQFGTNIPLNANSNSTAIALKNIYLYSIAAIVTGTPNGTIKLQACNDPETNQAVPTPVNWADITGSSFVLSSAGETMWNVTSCAYNYVRVVYTDASGGTSTATINLVFNGKGA